MNRELAARVEPREPWLVIEPSGRWTQLRLGLLWKYRELLYFLVWRELKVRYKQSLLGAFWIVIQPLLTMAVFTILFNQFLGIEADGDIPYPVFAYTALLPWTYFANSLTRISDSLVNNRNLISKVYFPRLSIPVAGILPGLVDFGIAFLILLALMAYYRIWPGTAALGLPLALALAALTALGMGLWFSALNVRYRDIKYVTPFVVQLWMYATPIIYPISRIPDHLLWIYSLNPMVGVVQAFRVTLLGQGSFNGASWVSVGVVFVFLISGLFYFRRMERTFADVV